MAKFDPSAPTDQIVQRFTVSFEFPVIFTENSFATENRSLVEVLSAREPERRHRVLLVVDRGVDLAWP